VSKGHQARRGSRFWNRSSVRTVLWRDGGKRIKGTEEKKFWTTQQLGAVLGAEC